jgi:sugar lactone lactonase YvrE
MQLMTRVTIPVFMIAALLAVRPGLTQTVSTIAGSGTAGYSGDNGPATSANIDTAEGLAVDGLGNTYIADSRNHRIRKIANGIITTVAGTGVEGFADGPATSAQFSFPRDVAVDSQNNLYIADTGNGRIRKVTPAGVVSTVAGNGTVGYSGDNGPATSAMLSYPAALATDSAGNVYIADTWNYRIRKLTSDGKIQTVAGNGSYGPFGDGGPATSASLGVILSITVDAQNTLYLSDTYNHRVRKVTSGGVISSVIGGGFGAAADGGAAQTATLKFPRGISADALGRLFVADSLNHRVRQVSQAGVISTVAGSGTPGYAGDDGAATSAKINNPVDVAAAPGGSLYFSDLWNYRVRSVQATGTGSRCGCDVNSDGSSNIVDVQLIINQALGITTAGCDVSGDGIVNIVDVQKVINAVLGLGCN